MFCFCSVRLVANTTTSQTPHTPKEREIHGTRLLMLSLSCFFCLNIRQKWEMSCRQNPRIPINHSPTRQPKIPPKSREDEMKWRKFQNSPDRAIEQPYDECDVVVVRSGRPSCRSTSRSARLPRVRRGCQLCRAARLPSPRFVPPVLPAVAVESEPSESHCQTPKLCKYLLLQLTYMLKPRVNFC